MLAYQAGSKIVVGMGFTEAKSVIALLDSSVIDKDGLIVPLYDGLVAVRDRLQAVLAEVLSVDLNSITDMSILYDDVDDAIREEMA